MVRDMVPQLKICAKNRSYKRYGEGYVPQLQICAKNRSHKRYMVGDMVSKLQICAKNRTHRDMEGDMVPQLQIHVQRTDLTKDIQYGGRRGYGPTTADMCKEHIPLEIYGGEYRPQLQICEKN